MNESCRATLNCGGQVAFVFRLPAGQVAFSGLFLHCIGDVCPTRFAQMMNQG